MRFFDDEIQTGLSLSVIAYSTNNENSKINNTLPFNAIYNIFFLHNQEIEDSLLWAYLDCKFFQCRQ